MAPAHWWCRSIAVPCWGAFGFSVQKALGRFFEREAIRVPGGKCLPPMPSLVDRSAGQVAKSAVPRHNGLLASGQFAASRTSTWFQRRIQQAMARWVASPRRAALSSSRVMQRLGRHSGDFLRETCAAEASAPNAVARPRWRRLPIPHCPETRKRLK